MIRKLGGVDRLPIGVGRLDNRVGTAIVAHCEIAEFTRMIFCSL